MSDPTMAYSLGSTMLRYNAWLSFRHTGLRVCTVCRGQPEAKMHKEKLGTYAPKPDALKP